MTIYDEHVRFYLEFVDRVLAMEPSLFRMLLAEIDEMLGDRVTGAHVCDVACGEGYVSRHLASRGAASVVGIDISVELIAEAGRRTDVANVTFAVDDARKLETLDDASFDVAVSQMALMDIEDHRAAFASVHRILKPDGVFVFTLLHPCFEGPHRLPDEPQFLVDDNDVPFAVAVRYYASEGHWNSGSTGMRGSVGSYHRMLSTYVNDLTEAGFRLDGLAEPLGPEGLFAQVPRVLVVAATKR